MRATIAALGLVPSRGLGVDASVLNGSFAVERKDGYAKLAQVFVPDVLRAIKAAGCDGHAYQSLIESDQLKDVIWGVMPFVVLMFIAVVLLCLIPGIATGLPNMIMGAK